MIFHAVFVLPYFGPYRPRFWTNKSLREQEQDQANLEYETDELRVVVADIVEFNNSHNENLEDRMVELENLVTTY